MTAIPPLQGATGLAPSRRPAAAAGGGFALPDAMVPSGPADAAPASVAPAALAGLLALQETLPDAARDRAARRHGRDMLAALAGLQRALLGGGDAAAALERLAGLVGNMAPAADPALATVLAALTLRCRVELARRG